MTTLARNAAHRSFAFLGIFFGAMETALLMAQAVNGDHPSSHDVEKLRAIVDAM